jgi:hypothetical protein
MKSYKHTDLTHLSPGQALRVVRALRHAAVDEAMTAPGDLARHIDWLQALEDRLGEAAMRAPQGGVQ